MSRYKSCPNCDGPLFDLLDISDLSERHQRALTIFVEKFRSGALEHGDLVAKKQWTEDKIMEQIDYVFYNIFELLDVQEGEKNG